MEDTEKKQMVRDILLQVVMILFFLVTYLYMHGLPQKLVAWLRLPRGRSVRAKRHFVRGAQLLVQARTSKRNGSSSFDSLANEALTEADQSIALNPRDAASYLLKAMILDLQGFRTSALDAIDAALSPLAAKSLAKEERGDALVKRAELKMAVSERGGGRVDSVVADLTESVKLNPKNARGWCLLGECYEENEMEEEAKKAYEEALELEPKLIVAEEALKRLSSS
ncbi:hypothetical protein PIB30_089467 [Stylosanthes scabra]|uniref:Uncharacterized protein n=1 Tax=Stylosanthes scabra TaxID=79078 RepID=A0ABU6ZSN5_9FABA|nr:hypothetical protein [Stylosanthes scabra]